MDLYLFTTSRGRTEAKACQNCEDINDSELNKEIFDLPWKQQKQNSHGTDGDTEDEVPNNGERFGEAERSISGRKEAEETEGIALEGNRLGPIRENIPVGRQVRQGVVNWNLE